MTDLNLPPYSLEAEQSVLGAMMLDNRVIDDVADILVTKDFYRADHQIIYDEIVSLYNESKPSDVVTVSDSLDEKGDIAELGGLSYLGGLAKNTPTTSNAKSYAQIIKERAMKRNLVDVCHDHIGRVYSDRGASAHQLTNSLGNALEAIDSKQGDSEGFRMPDIAVKAIDQMEQRFKADSDLIGYSTGLADLDFKTAGLQKGHLVVLGARPSMGKSSASAQFLKQCLVDGGNAVFFSLEMPATDLYNRMLAEQSGVSLARIRQPKQLDSNQWPLLTQASQVLNERNLIIDDQAGLSINYIRSRCRKIKRREGLDMVVIDYLQLMQFSGEGNKSDQIGEVTRQLKNMAKDLDVVVILLSQLNRSLEHRPNKRPIMSDLRDSGSIEADADLILFLYRDEVYNVDTDAKGICEINIGKQRAGEIGTVRSVFIGHLQRFQNYQYGVN